MNSPHCDGELVPISIKCLPEHAHRDAEQTGRHSQKTKRIGQVIPAAWQAHQEQQSLRNPSVVIIIVKEIIHR